jgi:hypothetical protein
MRQVDLAVSIGPNCRVAWHVRRHFNFERAYPFDWWVASTYGVMTILNQNFNFHVKSEDLVELNDPQTIYNRKLHLIHQHDFPRKDGKPIVNKDTLRNLNEKYAFLISRLREDAAKASNIAFFFGGHSSEIWRLSALAGTEAKEREALGITSSWSSMADELQAIFGARAHLYIVEVGTKSMTSGKNFTRITAPDDGLRLLNPGHFAEPASTFMNLMKSLDLSLSAAHFDENRAITKIGDEWGSIAIPRKGNFDV